MYYFHEKRGFSLYLKELHKFSFLPNEMHFNPHFSVPEFKYPTILVYNNNKIISIGLLTNKPFIKNVKNDYKNINLKLIVHI